MGAAEEEELYGKEYLDWKKQTLGAQVGGWRGKSAFIQPDRYGTCEV
jgi:hypothetical protein